MLLIESKKARQNNFDKRFCKKTIVVKLPQILDYIFFAENSCRLQGGLFGKYASEVMIARILPVLLRDKVYAKQIFF